MECLQVTATLTRNVQGGPVARAALCRDSRVKLWCPGGEASGTCLSGWGRVLAVVCGEQAGRGADPPGLDHELGHLIEVNPAEPDEDRRIPVIVRRDEELLWFGHEQFVALIEAGATHEHRVWQFVHADEQIAAHPERGKPVVGFLDDRGQRQRDPANVVLGHHPPMLWQLMHSASAPASNQAATRSHAAWSACGQALGMITPAGLAS